jgi:hypothetical protein
MVVDLFEPALEGLLQQTWRGVQVTEGEGRVVEEGARDNLK